MQDILFLAHRFPYPPDRGDKIRSWHMLKALCELAPVHACSLVDNPADLDHLPVLEAVCASVHTAPHAVSKLSAMGRGLLTGIPASVAACRSARLQETVNQLLATRSIGTIFAFSGQMAQFVPQNLGERRFVMDFVDVDSAKFAAYADQSSGPMSLANHVEARRLAAFEKDVASRADVCLFVSEAEAQLFRERTGLGPAQVQALQNGINLDHFNPAAEVVPADPGDGPLIVFTGQMDYRPNVEAVCDFVREVFPIVRNHAPKSRFAIVGRAPTDEVKLLASNPGVIVTGEVADTRCWLAACDVVVAPLKLARGIQNKVLEAMAMAKPVVAYHAAAEGINANTADGLFPTLNPQTMAEQILSFISEPSRARAFGNAARRCMDARYSWEAQLKGLRDIVTPVALEHAA